MDAEKTNNEIILYQPDETLKLDVRVEDETVWLTQSQMVELYSTSKQNISLHINNAIKEGEIDPNSVVKESLTTAADGKKYRTKYYNLDVIITVGYRVKSIRGTLFRRWATQVLKEHMLRGYTVNQRLIDMEERIDKRLYAQGRQIDKLREDVDFFIKTAIPPQEGVFFEGQIFQPYVLIAQLVKRATKRIVVIDNYLDESILLQLSKRAPGVTVDIYSSRLSRVLQQDVAVHNAQFPGVTLHQYNKAHDRFLIIDEEVYHIGASLKDLGKKLFAFSKMDVMTGTQLLANL